MVLNGLNPLCHRFIGLYFKSYQELARPTLISNAKITFSPEGATDLPKKDFAPGLKMELHILFQIEGVFAKDLEPMLLQNRSKLSIVVQHVESYDTVSNPKQKEF